MKILWFTWKDLKNPLAGGAELVNESLAQELVKKGNEVTLLVAGYPGCKQEEVVNGYKIIRVGGRWSVYWKAFRYYRTNMTNWPDLIIEEINTIPFFTQLFSKKKRVLLIHQLCREVWFHQMFFPLNAIGFLIEPLYLWLLRKNKVITISNSTKADLQKYGFKKENVLPIRLWSEIKPIKSLQHLKKFNDLTMLSLGAIREMKRPDQQIKAFEIAKKKMPELKLKVAGGGSGKYYDNVMKMIYESPFKKDIEYLGKVSDKKKIELMQKCHLIAVTSVKEGWGLIVTEANSQGTPAVVYNVDGLRDSVKHKRTGLLSTSNSPEGLAASIVKLLKDQNKYKAIQEEALKLAKESSFENCFKAFNKIINSVK